MTVKPVQIGSYSVGPGHPCFIVAEIGINHNGDLDTALRLIDAAVASGCQAVKFQNGRWNWSTRRKSCQAPRESFGTTNGDLKRALEFGEPEYAAVDRYCRERGSCGLRPAGTSKRWSS